MQFKYNDKIYGTDAIIEIDDVNYIPRNLSPDDRLSLGIEVVVNEPKYYDVRFYFDEGVPRSVESIQQTMVQSIKDRAREVILAIFPEWKQANMNAQSVELQDIWRRNGTWNIDEQALADTLQSAWNWIKLVRDHSNDLENEVLGLTFDELTAWREHDWPDYQSS